ncbi:MAG: ABC transporter permease [Pirellulaceae bacterium]|nr:ABC transporter permease [Planctomycetales bacterium]
MAASSDQGNAPEHRLATLEPDRRIHRPPSDAPFFLLLTAIGGVYVVFLLGMLAADVVYMTQSAAADQVALPPGWQWASGILRPFLPIVSALNKPEIRYSLKLTMISCLFTAILSVVVAVPLGYVLSRYRFPGSSFLDALLDIPIVLPPLVIGLSLLILFQFAPFRFFSRWVVYQVPGVILAQFMVAAAFAIRTMRFTYDQIDRRQEQVALTLGCSRAQAFAWVVFPRSWQGMITAGTMAWARALGEFGPLLIFAGATRNKTEVLSTTVFLELSIGDLEAAVAVSLMMVGAAVFVLMVARLWGARNLV